MKSYFGAVPDDPQLPHKFSERQMPSCIVSHPSSSATRNGGTPETWFAANLTNSQAIVTTMFLPAKACRGQRNKSRQDQAGTEQRA
jgi:hypothetical protein